MPVPEVLYRWPTDEVSRDDAIAFDLPTLDFMSKRDAPRPPSCLYRL